MLDDLWHPSSFALVTDRSDPVEVDLAIAQRRLAADYDPVDHGLCANRPTTATLCQWEEQLEVYRPQQWLQFLDVPSDIAAKLTALVFRNRIY
ncbi:MAG: hypothetical protein V3T53_03755 [Phycisphaerales bacterium]